MPIVMRNKIYLTLDLAYLKGVFLVVDLGASRGFSPIAPRISPGFARKWYFAQEVYRPPNLLRCYKVVALELVTSTKT
jgi:hypothetical protein